MPSFLDNIPSFVKNKYFITAMLFIMWMLFFDRNDIVSRFQLKGELSRLEEEQVYYQERIAEIEATEAELFTNEESLEKFAREEYNMKKDDEDLFIIIEED